MNKLETMEKIKEAYNDFLNDSHNFEVFGYKINASDAIQKIDEIAYEEEFRNFVDALGEAGELSEDMENLLRF